MTENNILFVELHRKRLNFAQFRPFSIFLNGKKVQEIKEGETVKIPLSPNDHAFQVKVGLKKSNVLHVTPHKHEPVRLEIERKKISKKTKWFLIAAWALFVALGALLITSIGAGVGFALGLLVRSYVMSTPQLIKHADIDSPSEG